jgi:hypothetical protein
MASVAKIDADYLGGDKPHMVVEGPSVELKADKAASRPRGVLAGLRSNARSTCRSRP